MSSSEQQWDAGGYARHARFVSDLATDVVDLLAPAPGERILDLGCGDGALSVRLQARGVDLVGVDSSPAMVAAARAAGVDARVMNCEALDFDGEFDAVFSNAAMHWMRDADAVIAGVRRALRPSGRFVGEFGGFGNVAAIVVALSAVLVPRGIDVRTVHPWYFPTGEEYRAKLENHGFTAQSVELIPRPTPLPTDMAGWLDTFASPFFRGMPTDEHAAARDEAVDLLRGALCDRNGRWAADYVRLRFLARLTA
jgi:SAM-dependent methyltransferase